MTLWQLIRCSHHVASAGWRFRPIRCSHLVASAGWQFRLVFNKANSVSTSFNPRSYITSPPDPPNESDMPPNESDKPPNAFYNLFSKFPISSFIVGLTGLFSIAYSARQFYLDRTSSEAAGISDFIKGLANSSVSFKPPECYIERPGLMSQVFLQSQNQSHLNATCLVIGPRGCGKSTLVKAALQERKGVVIVNPLEDRTASSVAKEILNRFSSKKLEFKEDQDSIKRLEYLLLEYKKSKMPIPTIVVEVDICWISDHLEYLLMVAKRLGADANLANFVIIVSAAIGSFNIGITYPDLGCNFIAVDEATDNESKDFFKKFFSSLNLSEEEKSGLAQMAVDAGFCNFRRMQSLASDLIKAGSSLESIKECLEEEAVVCSQYCVRASSDFIRLLGVKEKGSEGFQMLKNMSEGKQYVLGRDLLDVFGLETTEDFCKILYGVKPHPLTILMPSERVTVASKMMSKALAKALNKV